MPPLKLLFPQPERTPRVRASKAAAEKTCRRPSALRVRRGIQRASKAQSARLPAPRSEGRRLDEEVTPWTIERLAEVMVRVDVLVPEPVKVALAGASEQPGSTPAEPVPAKATLQERLTLPLKLIDVRVRVSDAAVPAEAVRAVVAGVSVTVPVLAGAAAARKALISSEPRPVMRS